MQDQNSTDNHKKFKLGTGMLVVAGLVVVGVVSGFVFKMNRGVGPPGNSQTQFSSTMVSNNAVKVYPGELTPEAMSALNGFSLSTQMQPDGSAVVTLTANNPEYKTQQYTVKPGESLYFVENNFADDSIAAGIPTDRNPADDTAVIVDANGFMVR